MANYNTAKSASESSPTTITERRRHVGKVVLDIMNIVVLALSIMLIVWMSIDTFEKVDFMQNHRYMVFQFWVCIIFMADFFFEMVFSTDRWHTLKSRLIFLLLSIPYLNIINVMNIELSHDALYFVRFIPLARGALAMSIVVGYMSKNAISSLFLSYISILLMVAYFCSLIFYQREYGVNPEVTSYWTALWWTAMNLVTVGCNINPVTVAGKIVAVILPITGMIIFPLFTVYLTNFVSRNQPKSKKE